MSEPLVTRNPDIQGGKPCLRGTRFPVGTLQRGFETWGLHGCRTQYHSLDDWTDEQLEEIATYPRLETHLLDVDPDDIGVAIEVDDDGSFSVELSYTPEEAPALTAAIQQTADAITAWRLACDEWEWVHR